jgi:NADPH:quinone reductase-like Zn-dependent oxidoreductase
MTKILISGLVTIHLAANLWHGSAHTQLAIALPPGKTAFVFVVILIAPIVAAGLVWTRYISIGLWVFFLSMLCALLFGAYHHYVLVSPDNIGHLPGRSPESRSQFIASAAVIALLELASALVGAFSLGSHLTQPRAHGLLGKSLQAGKDQ